MKQKLKKDLIFLKELWVRIALSIVGGVTISYNYFSELRFKNVQGDVERAWSNEALVISISTIFIVLYLLVAWLYGEDKKEETK